MIRVSTKDIIDILPYGDGKAILVEKNRLLTPLSSRLNTVL